MPVETNMPDDLRPGREGYDMSGYGDLGIPDVPPEIGSTINKRSLESGAITGLSTFLQGMLQERQIGQQADHLSYVKEVARKDAARDRQRTDSAVSQLIDNAQFAGRMRLAQAEQKARWQRAAVRTSAAERGVAGGSVEALETALAIQEAQETAMIERDVRNQALGAAIQGEAQRERILSNLQQVEAQAAPEELSPAFLLLQSVASGAQSFMQTRGAAKAAAAKA